MRGYRCTEKPRTDSLWNIIRLRSVVANWSRLDLELSTALRNPPPQWTAAARADFFCCYWLMVRNCKHLGNGEMGYNQTMLHSLRLFTDPSALSLKKVNIFTSEAFLSSTVSVSWWAPSGCRKSLLLSLIDWPKIISSVDLQCIFFFWQHRILLKLLLSWNRYVFLWNILLYNTT